MDETELDWFIPLKSFLEDRVVVAANKEREYHHEHETLADAEKFWATIIAMSAPDSTDKYWGNGKHMGDCTKQPITCNTCLIESTRMEARYVYNFIKTLVNEGYPDEVYQPAC